MATIELVGGSLSLRVVAPSGWRFGPIRPRLVGSFLGALGDDAISWGAISFERSGVRMRRDATLSDAAGGDAWHVSREEALLRGLKSPPRPPTPLEEAPASCGDATLEAARSADDGLVAEALAKLEVCGDLEGCASAMRDLRTDDRILKLAAKAMAARCDAALLASDDHGRVLDLLPSATPISLRRVRLLVEQRRWPEAIAELATVSRARMIQCAATEDEKVLLAVLAALRHAGRYTDASALAEAFGLPADMEESGLDLAAEAVARGAWTMASSAYSRVLSLDPCSRGATLWRARCDVARFAEQLPTTLAGLALAAAELESRGAELRGLQLTGDAAVVVQADLATVAAVGGLVDLERSRLWALEQGSRRRATYGEHCDAARATAAERIARFLLPRRSSHYSLLGVGSGAGLREIRDAHRRKQIETHPDKNFGDPTAASRFLAVQAAFRVLSDAKKRAAYDQEEAASQQ